MISSRARALGLAGVVLASCSPTPRPVATAPVTASVVAPVVAAVCRVGPDDGPLRDSALAERGIGGTGAPAIQLAERGIGGTGIIGVVTGFASICLAGHEVALPAGVPIEIGGVPSAPSALRAGQVAAVQASGPADALTARRIDVRYEVAGPVEAIAPDRLQVAGQTVLLGPDTWLRTSPALGQWVAVSGLRDGTGAVAATRLDLVSTHTVVVHGIVEQAGGQFHIGTLPIQPKLGDLLVPGQPVSVTGVYGDAGVQAASVSRDLLVADPLAYFGNYTSNFIVEGYAQPINGQIPFGLQSFAPASSQPVGAARSVATFQRTAAGDVRLNSITTPSGQSAGAGRLQPAPTPSSAGRFTPAPVPNRSFGGISGRGGGPDRAAGSRLSNGAASTASPSDPGGGPSGGAAGGLGGPGGSGGGRRR